MNSVEPSLNPPLRPLHSWAFSLILFHLSIEQMDSEVPSGLQSLPHWRICMELCLANQKIKKRNKIKEGKRLPLHVIKGSFMAYTI